jgi:hypothetical protein
MKTIQLRKKTRILISMCSLAFVLGSTSSKAEENKDENCFANVTIEPTFVAFTSNQGSQLAHWYKNTFQLNTVKDFSFPDGSVTGTLMQRGDFIVEVFNRKEPIVPEDIKPNNHRSEWNGFMKVGIFTDADLPTLKTCLVKNNVKASRIFDDEKLKIKLLQVIDPENNVLEIISRS